MEVEPFLEVQRSSYAAATEAFQAGWPEAQALDAAGMASPIDDNRYGFLATALRPERLFSHAAG